VKRRVLHPPHPFGDINVTPLIDVVMVMIVFYLIVGNLAASQRSPMPLPEARAGVPHRAQDVLAINILPGEHAPSLIIEGSPIEPDRLPSLIRDRLAAKPGTVVQVRASRDLAYAAVEPAIDACRRAGVTTVRLATEHVP
jgi:biopolymer transport protein ExbD